MNSIVNKIVIVKYIPRFMHFQKGKKKNQHNPSLGLFSIFVGKLNYLCMSEFSTSDV